MVSSNFLLLVFALIFSGCSSDGGSALPRPRPHPHPNAPQCNPLTQTFPKPDEGANNGVWSLFSLDSSQQVYWNTYNATPGSSFRKAWEATGLQDLIFGGLATSPNPPGPHISKSDWDTAVTYLKGDFKNSLQSNSSYTCYDRKKTNSLGDLINSNCSSPSPFPSGTGCSFPSGAIESSKVLCNVFAENTSGSKKNPIAADCCFYKENSSGPLKATGTCTISNTGDGNTSKIADGCYIDGIGPGDKAGNDTGHVNGYYCQNWEARTFDLTNFDLQLKNLYGDGEVIGCMSPSTAVGASTEWGGLGYGATCTEFDPSVTNVGAYIESPTYINPSLLYANAFSNSEIAGIARPAFSDPARASYPEYSMYKTFAGFCQNATYKDFCVDPSNPGDGRGGLGQLIGRMGPVSQNAYVSLMSNLNPTGYYNWQYDDANGQIQCDGPDAKAVAVFCADSLGDGLSADITDQIFSAGRADSRLAVYNNCCEDIWVQLKPTDSATGNPDLCQDPITVNKNDCLVKLPSKSSHTYDTPTKGLQSFNIWSKTGCDPTGFNCTTGETSTNNGTALKYGSQPDIETKIEATIGCLETDRSKCETTENGQPLGSSSYLDVSFVDGYSRPARLQLINNSTDPSSTCKTNPAPKVDLSLCPSSANLSYMEPPI